MSHHPAPAAAASSLLRWPRLVRLPLFGALALALGGCVVAGSDVPPPSVIAAPGPPKVAQLGGVYRERSIHPSQPQRPGASLYAFLTGSRRSPRAPGEFVEIRTSADGASLQIRLLGAGGRLLEATQLHAPADFRLGERGLEFRHQSRRETSNLGAGVSSQRRSLSSGSGGLIGRISRSSAGLLFFVVPMASSSEHTILWRRRGG